LTWNTIKSIVASVFKTSRTSLIIFRFKKRGIWLRGCPIQAWGHANDNEEQHGITKNGEKYQTHVDERWQNQAEE
jgi:hypothetical protein